MLFYLFRDNIKLIIMSIEQTTECNSITKSVVKLTDKYSRCIVLVYKFLNEMKASNAITEDSYITLLKGSIPIFQETVNQKMYLDEFFDSYKDLKKEMNSELRSIRKPVKERKKRVPRTRKEVVCDPSFDDDLINNLLASAETDTSDEVECVVDIIEKSKKREKKHVDQKNKMTEVVQTDDSDDEDSDEDSDEEISVRIWRFDGKNYLKDEENNVYDCDTHEVIGIFDIVSNSLKMEII